MSLVDHNALMCHCSSASPLSFTCQCERCAAPVGAQLEEALCGFQPVCDCQGALLVAADNEWVER